MTDVEKRIAALEAELAALKSQVKSEPEAEKKPRAPWPKYDPTAGMGMPASAVKAMCDVVPDFRGIAQEQKQVSVPGGLAGEGKRVERGTGWGEPRPLEPPPGVKYVDQMCDAQDALDKRDLERRLRGER